VPSSGKTKWAWFAAILATITGIIILSLYWTRIVFPIAYQIVGFILLAFGLLFYITIKSWSIRKMKW
jgi:hypothetical protein